jgi:RNA polymerase sigma-70 factor (ECF subfamily)
MTLAREATLVLSPRHDRWATQAAKIRAFEEGALVHLDALYRTARWLTHNRAEAEDLVQDTCLRAFKNFHQFTSGTNCRAWLLTILRRTFLNGLGRRGRELPEEDLALESASASATAPGDNNPEIELFRKTLPADVDRALRSLPVVFREAVVLVDLEGFSYREAAEALECPVGTVMSRLARGRGLLRGALRFPHVDRLRLPDRPTLPERGNA